MDKKLNGKMISLGRELRGISQLELSDQLKISQGTLSKIEKGFLSIPDDLLAKLSNKLKLPKDFFFRTGDTFSPNLYWRKKSKASQRVVSKAVAEMNLHRLNIQELLNSIEIEKKEIQIWDLEEGHTPVSVAKHLRQLWKIPSGPILNLFETIERRGIIIVQCNFESDDISGRSMYTEDDHALIFINSNLSFDRIRFTVAHELAHLLCHIKCSVPDERDIEKEANQFASEFLMPENDLKKHLFGFVTLEILADQKRFWRTSMHALVYKAKDSKIISERTYKSLLIQLSPFRLREPPALDPPRENSVILPLLMKMHLENLEYSEVELAALLKLSIDEMKARYIDLPINKLRVML
jgi:Zn-dependent peptidase ImmA (M78 family)